jgi:parallel beta-helix repeat protein
VNSSRITIEGLSLSNNVDGILLAYVSDSNAKYVTSIGNKVGINLEYCSNCEVSNSVTEEDMFDGIVLSGSSHCEIYQNNITGNYRGIYLTGTYNSTVHDNLIANNFQAGIVFDHALGNIFFHNNIVKNAIQLDASDSQKDSFDNVFKENYWSDYDGSDTDMDGIGNTLVPHQLDNFPLVGQYSKFDVKKENAVYQVEIISSSFPSDLKIDQGKKSLRFKLSAMGGIGFARIVLPYALLDGPFTIIVDEMLPLLVDTKSSGAFAQLYFVYPEGNCTAEIVGENATVLIAHAGSDTWASTGTPVLFNASKSVSNRGIRNFEWDFGDGPTGSGANVTHYYAEPGNYTSVLTIMDTEGNTAKDSAMVSVGSTLESKNPIIIPRWLVLGGLITICGVVAFSVGEKLIKRKRNKFPQVENHLTTDSKV